MGSGSNHPRRSVSPDWSWCAVSLCPVGSGSNHPLPPPARVSRLELVRRLSVAGSVHALAVSPTAGDLVVAYGERDAPPAAASTLELITINGRTAAHRGCQQKVTPAAREHFSLSHDDRYSVLENLCREFCFSFYIFFIGS